MDERVKNVAAEEARQFRAMTTDAVKSRAYLVSRILPTPTKVV